MKKKPKRGPVRRNPSYVIFVSLEWDTIERLLPVYLLLVPNSRCKMSQSSAIAAGMGTVLEVACRTRFHARRKKRGR